MARPSAEEMFRNMIGRRDTSAISLFFEKSVITIIEGAKHLPITAGASCFPEYYERRVFYDNL